MLRLERVRYYKSKDKKKAPIPWNCGMEYRGMEWIEAARRQSSGLSYSSVVVSVTMCKVHAFRSEVAGNPPETVCY
jgi:hypothetical protein